MTFFQRILGQRYKWVYVLKYNFAITNSGIRANLLSNIPLVLNSLAVIFVWSKANPSVAIFTYLIVGRIYKSFAESVPEIGVAQDVIEGRLTNKLLYPRDYFSLRFFTLLGRRLN